MRKLQKTSLPAAGAAGLAAALALTALLCLPFAAAMSREALPLEGAAAWAALSAGISVFIATLAAARLRRRQAVPTGACIAGGYVLLAALICALGGEGFRFGPWLLWLGGAALLGALLGAVMSIHRAPRKKRRSRG